MTRQILFLVPPRSFCLRVLPGILMFDGLDAVYMAVPGLDFSGDFHRGRRSSLSCIV